jgi:hypothetical protein
MEADIWQVQLFQQVLEVSVHASWFAPSPGNKSGTFFTVSPGDIIFASVYYINGMYAFQMTDETSGKIGYTLQSCYAVCSHLTAEWIVEKPTTADPRSLADYSTVTFMGATAGTGSMTGGISAFPHQSEINMVLNGTVLSSTSDLAPDSEGTMFTVTWHASQ